MANYAGSRSNALINSKIILEGGSAEKMNAAMRNANETIIGIDKIELKASKSEHNHSGKRQFK